MRLAWPLVGRWEELRLIEAAIKHGNSSGVVIRGAAGVGKSRVAREALNLAASKGFETRWAVGTASAHALPLGAFAAWAGSAIGDQLRVVRDVIEAVTSSPKGAAVVLAVDDVPLLDDLSAFVVQGTLPLAAEQGDALQIVSAPADLDRVRGTPAIHHTGVVWQGGRPSPAIAAPVPRILVSLSTLAFAGQRRMLKNILEAIAPLTVEATVTVGPGIDASGLRIPGNASMHAWLEHDEVLATTSLVVGHGGHSTTMRALSFGIPLVVIPANTLIDQPLVGAVLEEKGAGILLRKHARAVVIRAAIESVLQDRAYRQAAARLGEQIRERDGAEVAANLISQFVRTTQAGGRLPRSSAQRPPHRETPA